MHACVSGRRERTVSEHAAPFNMHPTCQRGAVWGLRADGSLHRCVRQPQPPPLLPWRGRRLRLEMHRGSCGLAAAAAAAAVSTARGAASAAAADAEVEAVQPE